MIKIIGAVFCQMPKRLGIIGVFDDITLVVRHPIAQINPAGLRVTGDVLEH
jgi:hypothetical protein